MVVYNTIIALLFSAINDDSDDCCLSASSPLSCSFRYSVPISATGSEYNMSSISHINSGRQGWHSGVISAAQQRMMLQDKSASNKL